VWRHSALTRALLRLRQGRAEEAIERATAVAALAEAAGDKTLFVRTNIVRAQALWQSGRTSEALSDLQSAATRLTGQSLTVQLEYERTLAALHDRSGRSDAAGGHHARARRITRAIGAGPARVGAENGASLRAVHGGQIVQDLLLAILHADHPELAAASLVAAVRASGIGRMGRRDCEAASRSRSIRRSSCSSNRPTIWRRRRPSMRSCWRPRSSGT
jgi:hypothetical protein